MIIGRVLGAAIGMFFGNVLGLIIGFFLGWRLDRLVSGEGRVYRIERGRRQQQNHQFIDSTFSVMGHIAKSSGRVSEADIMLASSLMDRLDLTGEMRQRAKDNFRRGKAGAFDLAAELRELRQNTVGRRDLLQFFLEMQIQLAFANGHLHESKRHILRIAASELGFSVIELERILSMIEAQQQFHQSGGHYRHHGTGGSRHQTHHVNPAVELQNAYQILGVSADSDEREIKKAYRKLMSQHHPDKLAAKGLPQEMMEMAKQRTQDIQKAYELVKKHRG